MITTTPADTFREIMSSYDDYRVVWVRENGTDAGFDDWFTGEVMPVQQPEEVTR